VTLSHRPPIKRSMGMKVPYVNAVGLTVYPQEFSARPRRAPLSLRVLAAVLIVLFGFTVISTSVVSVGSYCLTSDGGDTRNLSWCWSRQGDGKTQKRHRQSHLFCHASHWLSKDALGGQRDHQ